MVDVFYYDAFQKTISPAPEGGPLVRYSDYTAIEAENARLEREAENWLTLIAAERQKTDTAEAHLAEALKGERNETISAVFQTVGECLAGMTHDQVSENARRKIEAAIHAARRVREGGKVDG